MESPAARLYRQWTLAPTAAAGVRVRTIPLRNGPPGEVVLHYVTVNGGPDYVSPQTIGWFEHRGRPVVMTERSLSSSGVPGAWSQNTTALDPTPYFFCQVLSEEPGVEFVRDAVTGRWRYRYSHSEGNHSAGEACYTTVLTYELDLEHATGTLESEYSTYD